MLYIIKEMTIAMVKEKVVLKALVQRIIVSSMKTI
jgi:hypothetical protein